jgi:hypothetical protein
MSEPVDPRPLEEAIAAIERRAASATEAEIQAAYVRQVNATSDDGVDAYKAVLDYACIINFEDLPREHLWFVVNRLGATLGKTGLDREPNVRQQLAAALVYISKGWDPSDDDTAFCGIAGVRAGIVAEPGNYPTLWCRDSGSDWAEHSGEDMSPEAFQTFYGISKEEAVKGFERRELPTD